MGWGGWRVDGRARCKARAAPVGPGASPKSFDGRGRQQRGANQRPEACTPLRLTVKADPAPTAQDDRLLRLGGGRRRRGGGGGRQRRRRGEEERLEGRALLVVSRALGDRGWWGRMGRWRAARQGWAAGTCANQPAVQARLPPPRSCSAGLAAQHLCPSTHPPVVTSEEEGRVRGEAGRGWAEAGRATPAAAATQAAGAARLGPARGVAERATAAAAGTAVVRRAAARRVVAGMPPGAGACAWGWERASEHRPTACMPTLCCCAAPQHARPGARPRVRATHEGGGGLGGGGEGGVVGVPTAARVVGYHRADLYMLHAPILSYVICCNLVGCVGVGGRVGMRALGQPCNAAVPTARRLLAGSARTPAQRRGSALSGIPGHPCAPARECSPARPTCRSSCCG